MRSGRASFRHPARPPIPGSGNGSEIVGASGRSRALSLARRLSGGEADAFFVQNNRISAPGISSAAPQVLEKLCVNEPRHRNRGGD
jgi:hypothetical protein